MPVSNSGTYALVIVSLGILGVIVSFLIQDKKKYYIALSLSVFVVGLGVFEFVTSGLRQWRAARRIASLQKSQRLSLEVLQERLRQAQSQSRSGASAPAVPAPKDRSAPERPKTR
jgi:hypothetical protein